MVTEGELSIYCGHTPIFDAEYDSESDRSPTEAVIEALADAADVDPTEIPTLYEYVDPDAFNKLFDGSDRATEGDTVLSFQVERWHVFIRSDGRIRVCDSTQPTNPQPVFEPCIA